MKLWLPFLSGCAGGLAIVVGAYFAWEAIVNGISGADWQYVVLLILSAACLLAGGGIILNSALEIL